MTPKDAKVIEIQKLAYQIYLQRCRDGRPGSAEDDWLRACEQVNRTSPNGRNENPVNEARGNKPVERRGNGH
jgi:DUF2934 family protein